MSIFASRTIKVLPIPFDLQPSGEPHTVTIQRLPGRHLEHARALNQERAVADLKRMGGAAFQRELEAVKSPDAPATDVTAAIAERRASPLFGVDLYTVLAKGIKAWTYEEPLTPVETIDDDGTKALRIPAIDDLTDEARTYIGTAIMELGPRTTEDDRKNG